MPLLRLFDIATPPRQLPPLLGRALRAAGGAWQRRFEGQSVVWEPQGNSAPPLRFRLEPGPAPTQSRLRIEGTQLPDEANRVTIQAVTTFLTTQGLTLHPIEPNPPAPRSPLPAPANLQSPISNPYAERRRIYRAQALDKGASAEQRFHAARVLAASDDATTAAQVLGALAGGDDALADEALAVLGTLGRAALPALWRLDAQAATPQRAIEVARQLVRAGDAETAGFRLDRLTRHPDEATRLAALAALGEMGESATARFETLARAAAAPTTRLAAARWLLAQGATPDLARETLADLANQTAAPDLAARAVELLGTLPGDAAREALLALARGAGSADARLAAAERLNQRGDTTAARAALLVLAQGTDDLAAGAALDMLVNVSDRPMDDTERLMNTATLKSVRRRAAELLAQPHQPEAVQQAAARLFLALDRPAQARPVLARLARGAEAVEIRRWAAQQLAQLGAAATDDLRAAFHGTTDPVAGQALAEGLLAASQLPDDRRQAAIWLAEHSNLPRAVEVLGDLALSARVSGSDAVRALNVLNRYAATWAGAARVLATVATESPHPAARARALDLLLREHPAELPLSLLVDLAVTGSIGSADRLPVLEQLAVLAQPAATRIAARLTADEDDTDRRWQLLDLLGELPDRAATPALLQLSTRAPQNRIRYVAAAQLIERGHPSAGYAALAAIALDDPDAELRERALYELALGLPDTLLLLQSILAHTRYEDSYALTRHLLYLEDRSPLARLNHWLDARLLQWEGWVAHLPLRWLDRLLGR